MISSSAHTVGHAQVDGRRYIMEAHTDHTGKVHSVEYLAAVAADYVAIRTARVAPLEAQLAEAEAAALLG